MASSLRTRPAFRRGYAWTAIKPIRLNPNNVIQPGEDLPHTLDENGNVLNEWPQWRIFMWWKRGWVGVKDDPSTAQWIEVNNQLAGRSKRVPIISESKTNNQPEVAMLPDLPISLSDAKEKSEQSAESAEKVDPPVEPIDIPKAPDVPKKKAPIKKKSKKETK